MQKMVSHRFLHTNTSDFTLRSGNSRTWVSVFQPGLPGTLGLLQRSPWDPPEVIQMLQTTLYCNSHVQMVPRATGTHPWGYAPPKELKNTDLGCNFQEQKLFKCGTSIRTASNAYLSVMIILSLGI